MAPAEPYSLVWESCKSNRQLAKRFYAPLYTGYLPFFIWGKELEILKSKKDLELREEHLLKGILFVLHKSEQSMWVGKIDRKTLLYLLEVLRSGFGLHSNEQLVLNTAQSVREKNGPFPASKILEVGVNLIPDSSKIKSDLIMNLWASIAPYSSGAVVLEKTLTLLEEINLEDILPDAKQMVCYYGLCSFVLLKKDTDTEPFMQKYVYPNVEHQYFKNRIMELLNTPEKFTPEDMVVIASE